MYQPKKSKSIPKLCKNTGITKAMAMMAIKPFCSALTYFMAQGLSLQPKKILEPSRGGMGKILNTAKMMLNIIKLMKNAAHTSCTVGEGINELKYVNNAPIKAK